MGTRHFLTFRGSPSPSTIRDQAVVIGTYPYGEEDLILRVLTQEHGKVALFARAGKKGGKKFQGRIDLMDIGVVEYQERGETYPLKSFSSERTLLKLRDSLNHYIAASSLCEIADSLSPEKAPDPEFFFSLREGLITLGSLEDEKKIPKSIYETIAALTTHAGVAHPHPRPSWKHLFELLTSIENFREKKLATKDELLSLCKSLSQTQE